MEEKIVFTEYIDDREKMVELNNDIKELLELFNILDACVDTQHDSLDIIEDNITSSKYKVEEAEINLQVADKYKKKSKILKIGVIGLVASGASIPLILLMGTKLAICVITWSSLLFFLK